MNQHDQIINPEKTAAKLKVNRKWHKITTVCIILCALSYISSTLEEQQSWGMDFILYVQDHRSPKLDYIVHFFSAFGFESFFVLIPFITFFGNKKEQLLGLNLAHILNYTLLINSVLKTIFEEPRPTWINTSINGRTAGANEFSYPSGHSFASCLCWLWIISHYHKLHKFWVPFGGSILIFVTCFSRVYFGVHYPHDVAAGVLCGLLMFAEKHYFVLIDEECIAFTSNKDRQPHETEQYEHRLKVLRRGQYFQVTVWVLMFLVIHAAFDKHNVNQQMGLFYSLGCLFCSLCGKYFVHAFEDNHRTAKRVITRTVLGVIPFLFFIKPIHYVYSHHTEWLSPFLFLVGAAMTAWLTLLAPHVYIRFNLGTMGGRYLAFPSMKGRKHL